jgi:hypothetical protein
MINSKMNACQNHRNISFQYLITKKKLSENMITYIKQNEKLQSSIPSKSSAKRKNDKKNQFGTIQVSLSNT